MSQENTRSVVKQVRIKASHDAVWRAITEADQIVRWFALDAKVKPGVGGYVWLSWPGMAGEERIDVWEPGKHFQTRGPDRPRIATDWYVEGEGGETTLRLVHSGFGEGADWDAEYDAFDRGWTVFLQNLKHMLERHPGASGQQLMVPVPVGNLSMEQAWQRLLGPGLLGLERAGERSFRARAVTGEALTGEVDLWLPPRVLGITVKEWNDARVTVDISGCDGEVRAWVCILTWGLDAPAVEALRARWQPTFEGMFRQAA
ncbi:SRPBCC domain-containing protein [Pyxidicoccus parkwayensis]|uniref:SRPBCC domain-containing protein n=1 Tax=Pyxidicoccus parkwayensis TaxID=2813578 RepID=A0ABX7P6D4_9BACT|nr:SRPBCC domain-containing protein [Pyxidicoccus parkwaysis]QSQ26013.1 SRPBCC domain-containing protein [Pyxidicoccus parkwaysis]